MATMASSDRVDREDSIDIAAKAMVGFKKKDQLYTKDTKDIKDRTHWPGKIPFRAFEGSEAQEPRSFYT